MTSSAPSRLKRLLASGACIAAPGASDPFTACIIERAGFNAIYLGGNALGLSIAQGQPLTTLTETVDCAARIVRVVDAPLIVDAGAGFGDPTHVHRTVREIESTGAAALHIDDQPYPKRVSYHRGKGGLAPLDLPVAKFATAVQARRDPDFLIIARTDALRVTQSFDEVIRRGRAYQAAGADAFMVLDLEPEQVPLVRQRLPDIPLVWIGGVPSPAPNIAALNAAGFALALYPFNTIAAIAEAVTQLWSGMRETGELPQSGAFLTHMRAQLQDIIGMKIYWDIEDRTVGARAPDGE
jgi:2-methylisocitrate lyase-like PEP mutase family enzyme